MADASDFSLLTVLIPVYNEIGTIDELLRQVAESPLKHEQQIVVVDGGSNDGSIAVLDRWRDAGRIELLRPAGIRGKGGALKAGLAVAQGQYTIIQDADLEYDPQDYSRLLEPLLKGEADVAYGSRYLTVGEQTVGEQDAPRTESSRQPGDYLTATRGTAIRRERRVLDFGVRMLNVAVRVLYGGRITDEATCYKVFRTEDLRRMRLECERFEFCPEVTAKAYRMGLRVIELPIRYAPRSAAEGKKLRWTDGIQAFSTLWHYRRWVAPAVPKTPVSTEDRDSATAVPAEI